MPTPPRNTTAQSAAVETASAQPSGAGASGAAERELMESNRSLQILADVSRKLAAARTDVIGSLRDIARHMTAFVGDSCALVLLDEPGLQVTSYVISHRDPATEDRLLSSAPPCPFPIDELTREVVRTRQVHVLDEPPGDGSVPRVPPYIRLDGPASVMAAPLFADQNAAGVIFMSRGPEGAPFSDHDKLLFEQVADRIGLTLALADDMRRLAEKRRRLVHSEQQLALVTDSLPVLVAFIDETFHYRFVNRAYVDWFRLPREQILGHHMSEVLGMAAFERLREPLEKAIRGEPSAFEGEVPYARGGRRIIRARYVPQTGVSGRGLVAFVDDITPLKESERVIAFLSEASKILASSLDYEVTLQNVARSTVPRLADWCAVDMFDADGRAQLLAVAHVDETREEYARELRRRFPPAPRGDDGLAVVFRTRKTLLVPHVTDDMLVASASSEEHLRIARELGLRSAIVAPLLARGRVLGAITLVTSETDRHFDEADLAVVEELASRAALAIENAELYREATRERQRAEEAGRAKDEFLATLSHELRTPLSAITGWAAMLRTGALPPEKAARALETIERNARVQAQLIDDILDVARIVSGKMRLETAPIEINDVIERAIETVRPTADAKGVLLVPSLVRGAGRVLGDGARLQQVVWNLLSNAVKFTPEGGRVDVRLEVRGRSVEIVVEDSGQGIPPEFLPHVFDRFRQADSTITRAQGGLGLGLAIVRHLVEIHGGTASVSSAGLGRGATFRVQLPRIDDGTPAAPRTGDGGATVSTDAILDGVSIVVVEDEPDTRMLLQSILEVARARVTTAATAREGIRLVEQHRPDVLLSDIGMPIVDGYSLVSQVRAHGDPAIRRTPALALTAFARSEDRARALDAGFDVHMSKPVEPRELVAVVAHLARRRAREVRA